MQTKVSTKGQVVLPGPLRGKMRRQDLDGDGAVESRVACARGALNAVEPGIPVYSQEGKVRHDTTIEESHSNETNTNLLYP
jgi:bifunctional DNA-binding transcriptional regulator/antitoxin component of YhaV-PrlF toxin-antitoxin module